MAEKVEMTATYDPLTVGSLLSEFLVGRSFTVWVNFNKYERTAFERPLEDCQKAIAKILRFKYKPTNQKTVGTAFIEVNGESFHTLIGVDIVTYKTQK